MSSPPPPPLNIGTGPSKLLKETYNSSPAVAPVKKRTAPSNCEAVIDTLSRPPRVRSVVIPSTITLIKLTLSRPPRVSISRALWTVTKLRSTVSRPRPVSMKRLSVVNPSRRISSLPMPDTISTFSPLNPSIVPIVFTPFSSVNA